MAGTFWDVLVPSLAQAGGQAGVGALQGMTQGPFLTEELRKQKDEAAMRALQMMIQKQQFPLSLQQQQLEYQQQRQMFPLTLAEQQAKIEHLRGQAERERELAGMYRKGFGPGMPTDIKEAAMLGMDIKEFLTWKSQLRPTTDERQSQALGMPLKDYLDYKKGLIAGAKLTPLQLDFMSDQALAGDTTVFQNLGRGLQGAENIVALRDAIAKKGKSRGISGQELAAINAELAGIKAGERALGTRAATFGMAGREAEQMAGLVLETSKAVPRSDYLLLNKLVLAYKRATGNEEIVQFDAALNSFVNAYSRAISPTGVATVEQRQHAREMLERAFSAGQIEAAIAQMKKEMAAAGQAPGIVRKEFREAVTGKESPQSVKTPNVQPSLPKVKTDADYNALPSGTEFLDPDGRRRRKP